VSKSQSPFDTIVNQHSTPLSNSTSNDIFFLAMLLDYLLPAVDTITLIYACFGILLLLYLSKLRPVKLVHAPANSFLKDGTLNSVKSLHKMVIPPPWCWSSTFQIIFFLLRNLLCDRKVDFINEDIVTERGSVKLSWAKEEPDNMEPPILLFLHGLMCSSDDLPGTGFIHAAIKRGWKVVVHNRPGHVEKLQTPRFCCFGDWRDVDVAVKHIKQKYPKSHVAAVAFSAGVYPLLRYLGEMGEASQLDAAVSISGGIRMTDGLNNCSVLFQQIFLYKAKQFFFEPNEALLRKHDTLAYDQCMGAMSSEAFMKACVPFITGNTKGTWKEVQALIDPFPTMLNIKTNILFLNAEDDPVVQLRSIEPYYNTVFRANPHLLLALSSTGSHCPFLHGCFSPEDYSMTTTLEFVAHQVQLSSLRRNATRCSNEFKLRKLFQSFSPPKKEDAESPRTSVLRKRLERAPLDNVPMNVVPERRGGL
jgi:predicted alpha/beta-fold hydrolase